MVNEETLYFRKFSYETVASLTAQSLLVYLELSPINLLGMSRRLRNYGWVGLNHWDVGVACVCGVTKTILTNAVGQCCSSHLTWWNKMLLSESKSAHYSFPESLTVKKKAAKLNSVLGDKVDLFSDISNLANHPWQGTVLSHTESHCTGQWHVFPSSSMSYFVVLHGWLTCFNASFAFR